jgi:hypothetical protein
VVVRERSRMVARDPWEGTNWMVGREGSEKEGVGIRDVRWG